MSTTLQGWGASVRFADGTRPFAPLDFSFGSVRTGLVGRNGAGKSTLLRLAAGLVPPSTGRVEARGRVLLLDKLGSIPAGYTIADALGVTAELAALARAHAGEASLGDLDRLEGKWDLEDRVQSALSAVSMEHVDPATPFTGLSGGEQARVHLSRLHLNRPDFVLLDEPTNHLDRTARTFVYDWVEGWAGGLVVVSHDQVLLNQMQATAYLDDHGLRMYGSNYTFFRAKREAERAAAEDRLAQAQSALDVAQRQAQETRERQEQRQASGERKGHRTGVSRMAMGILKRRGEATAGRMAGRHDARVERAAEEFRRAKAALIQDRRINIDLSSTAVHSRKHIFTLRSVNVRYEAATREVWARPLDFSVYGPERIALRGSNGSGKSTLMRLASGAVAPSSGEVELPQNPPAMLDQSVSVLDPSRSLLENVRLGASSRSEEELRLILARFLFDAEAADRPASVLSGGERMRAGLACLLCREQAPELLLLDEPTNNLDLEAVDEMVSVLEQFKGALIVASHDVSFLERLRITRTINLDGGLPETA